MNVVDQNWELVEIASWDTGVGNIYPYSGLNVGKPTTYPAFGLNWWVRLIHNLAVDEYQLLRARNLNDAEWEQVWSAPMVEASSFASYYRWRDGIRNYPLGLNFTNGMFFFAYYVPAGSGEVGWRLVCSDDLETFVEVAVPRDVEVSYGDFSSFSVYLENFFSAFPFFASGYWVRVEVTRPSSGDSPRCSLFWTDDPMSGVWQSREVYDTADLQPSHLVYAADGGYYGSPEWLADELGLYLTKGGLTIESFGFNGDEFCVTLIQGLGGEVKYDTGSSIVRQSINGIQTVVAHGTFDGDWTAGITKRSIAYHVGGVADYAAFTAQVERDWSEITSDLEFLGYGAGGKWLAYHYGADPWFVLSDTPSDPESWVAGVDPSDNENTFTYGFGLLSDGFLSFADYAAGGYSGNFAGYEPIVKSSQDPTDGSTWEQHALGEMDPGSVWDWYDHRRHDFPYITVYDWGDGETYDAILVLRQGQSQSGWEVTV